MSSVTDISELLALQSQWSPPVELASPTPRSVRLTWMGKVVRGIAAGLVVLGVLACATVLVFWVLGALQLIPNQMPEQQEPEPLWPALFLPPFFLGIRWIVTWRLRLQSRLLGWGEPAVALVADLSSVKGGKRVSYRFLDRTGALVRGSTVVSRSSAPCIGETATVLYDVQQPRRNTLYPMQLVEISTPQRAGT